MTPRVSVRQFVSKTVTDVISIISRPVLSFIQNARGSARCRTDGKCNFNMSGRDPKLVSHREIQLNCWAIGQSCDLNSLVQLILTGLYNNRSVFGRVDDLWAYSEIRISWVELCDLNATKKLTDASCDLSLDYSTTNSSSQRYMRQASRSQRGQAIQRRTWGL